MWGGRAAFHPGECHTYAATKAPPHHLTGWHELITQCSQGQPRAQAEAYQRVWKDVFPAVYRLLRNREEAEDTMQESIIKGFERLGELQNPSNYPGWQRQISVRMALNKLRSRKLFVEVNDDMYEVADEKQEHTPWDSQSLNRAIARLPDGYRLVIQLHLGEGMSHEEIGQAMDISPSTSRSQYSRALNKLRLLLKETHAHQV